MTALQKVEREAAKTALAQERLEYAIRLAHAEGISLRVIAAHAGMSHEKVRGLIRSD